MNILFSAENYADDATLTQSSEHPSFPAVNVQHRWFVKPWRSKYGEGSGWGQFRIASGSNLKIWFDEGGAELEGTLVTGDYDADTLCTAIKTAMEAAGALTYTVTYDDSTNLFTIAASGNFSLHLSKESASIWQSIGYTTGIDTASAASHTADSIRIHTQEELKFNFGAYTYMRFVMIKNHNLQSTANIRIRYYSDAYITLQDTDILTWNPGIIAAVLNQNYPYALLYISDPDNPDLYVEIGRVWIGSSFTPFIGFSMERNATPQDPSVVSESENGQTATIQRTKFSAWDYTFEGVKPLDKPYFDEMFEAVGTSKALVICERPDESDITPYTYYVSITGWEWEHIAGDWWKLMLEIKEER